MSSKDIDTQQKPSTFALYVDEKLKLLDNRARILTEKRISDILFEAEMGSMPSIYQITITTLIYDQPIMKLPLNLTVEGVWSHQRVLNETLFCLKHFYILTNMSNSLLTDDTLTFYVMNSSAQQIACDLNWASDLIISSITRSIIFLYEENERCFPKSYSNLISYFLKMVSGKTSHRNNSNERIFHLSLII